MSAGYGRGYYGASQLARAPKKRSWFTIVAVLGAGAAVVWLLWPRKATTADPLVLSKEPEGPSPVASSSTGPLVVINTTSVPQGPASHAVVAQAHGPVPFATGAFLKQLEDDAMKRGFLSVKDYEDSVVASAKQLQASGAKVMLAPHLQHLAPQLEAVT